MYLMEREMKTEYEFYERARLKARLLADEHVRRIFDDKFTETQHRLCWEREYNKQLHALITPPNHN